MFIITNIISIAFIINDILYIRDIQENQEKLLGPAKETSKFSLF